MAKKMAQQKIKGKDTGNGVIFLGKDKKTWGEEGTGNVFYDPDFECGGTFSYFFML